MNPGHEAVTGVPPVTTTATGGNLRQPAGISAPSANPNRTNNARNPTRTPPAGINGPTTPNPTGPSRTPVASQPTSRSVPRPGARPNIIGYKIRRISTLRRYCVPVTTVILVLASVVVIAILIKVVLDNYYYFCVKSFKFIPLDKWCDGQADCSGNEDELRCVQKISFGNLSTVRFTDSGSVLQLLTSQNQWSYICSDGFDAAKAKAVCAQIGFSSDPTFSSVSSMGLTGPFSSVQVAGGGVQTIPINGASCASVVSLRCIACGLNHRKERIIGGHDTPIENSPWQCSLQYMGQHICGCSLISPQYALTAAHCFQRAQQQVDRWRIECGHSSLSYTFASKVEKIYVYSQYNLELKPNDIAVMKLKYDMSFSDSIRPVCLPGFDNNLPDGTPLLVTGWGHTVEGGGTTAPTLQEVTVNLISSDLCNRDYYGQILNTMICAGRLTGGADTCQGDSGGPLCYLGDFWEIVGVVSWGDGCGRPGKPGVYTRVSPYLPWIYQVMRMDQ